jgi:hypothetical protein
MTQPPERRTGTIGLAVADGTTVILAWAAGCSYVFRQDLSRLVMRGPEWLLAWFGGVHVLGPALAFVTWLLAGFAVLGLAYTLLWRLGRRAVRRAADVGTPLRAAVPAWSIAVLLVITVVGSGLRLRGLGAALNYDELVTAHYFVAAPSLWAALSRQVVFNNHPAFTLLARTSQALFGVSEVALRMPALVLGCLAIPATWWVGRATLPAAGTLAAAAVVAFHPLHVSYSQSARGYSGLILFGLIAVALFDRVTRTGSSRAAVAFVLASVCAAWFHLYGAWLLAVEALYVVVLVLGHALVPHRMDTGLTAAGFRAIWPALGLAGVGVIAVYGPMWPSLFWAIIGRGRGASGTAFASEVVLAIAGFGRWPMAAVPVGLSLVGVVNTWSLRPFLWGALLFVPLGAMAALSPADTGVRFFSYWVPFFALLVGAGVAVGVGRPRRWRIGLSVVTLAAFIYVLGAWTKVILAEARSSVTREAAHLACSLAPEGKICTLRDAEILTFYLGNRLVSVGSVREYERAPIPVCVAFDVDWMSPAERELFEYLGRRGTRTVFEDVVVFDVER